MWKRRFVFGGKGPGALLHVGELEGKNPVLALQLSSLALLAVSSSYQIITKPARSTAGLQISALPWSLIRSFLVNLLTQLPPINLSLGNLTFLRQICPEVFSVAHYPLQDEGQGTVRPSGLCLLCWPYLLTVTVPSMRLCCTPPCLSAHGLPLPEMPSFPPAPTHLQRPSSSLLSDRHLLC